jgi:hypothetical protein
MSDRTEDAGAWYAERCTTHARRERAVWDEYLRMTKSCAGDLELYTRSEPLAWRRLRRGLAEVAHLRRRDAFERDRALADQRPRAVAS